eukprot:1731818-Pleurochrysis_carterae.AAC.2
MSCWGSLASLQTPPDLRGGTGETLRSPMLCAELKKQNKLNDWNRKLARSAWTVWAVCVHRAFGVSSTSVRVRNDASGTRGMRGTWVRPRGRTGERVRARVLACVRACAYACIRARQRDCETAKRLSGKGLRAEAKESMRGGGWTLCGRVCG